MHLNTKSFITQLTITTIASCFVFLLVLRAFPEFIKINIDQLLIIFGFMAAITLVHFLVLKLFFVKWPKHIGFLYPALSIVKSVLCLLFLIPALIPKTPLTKPYALSFMIIFFVYLFFEIIFLLRTQLKNQKNITTIT